MNFFFKFYLPKTDLACFSSTDIYYKLKILLKKNKFNKKECYFFHYK